MKLSYKEVSEDSVEYCLLTDIRCEVGLLSKIQPNYLTKTPEMKQHYVVYVDKVLVGGLSTEELDFSIYKIINMAILPSFQSKGIGRWLMKEVENKLENQGALGIELVSHPNPKTVGFWNQLNYQTKESQHIEFVKHFDVTGLEIGVRVD